MIEIIYIIRHGFRADWVADGTAASKSSPTGIPHDPTLAPRGVSQAKELADHLAGLEDPVDVVYSSPYYRCIQTLQPSLDRLLPGSFGEQGVRVEWGFSEYFGRADSPIPPPPTVEVLSGVFPEELLNQNYKSLVHPDPYGETIPLAHERAAEALDKVISSLDQEEGKDGQKARTLLICSHAASVTTLSRALTGILPQNIGDYEFRAHTCGFSKFVRKTKEPVRSDLFHDDGGKTRLDWKNGKGIAGGWDCLVNSDTSFLTNGQEGGWAFGDDPIFKANPTAYDEYVRTGKLTEPES